MVSGEFCHLQPTPLPYFCFGSLLTPSRCIYYSCWNLGSVCGLSILPWFTFSTSWKLPPISQRDTFRVWLPLVFSVAAFPTATWIMRAPTRSLCLLLPCWPVELHCSLWGFLWSRTCQMINCAFWLSVGVSNIRERASQTHFTSDLKVVWTGPFGMSCCGICGEWVRGTPQGIQEVLLGKMYVDEASVHPHSWD